MADESTNEEEPKERKNEYFDDDEDFGLPDLEYDELDDEDDEPLEEELDLEVEVEGEDEALEELELEEPVEESQPEPEPEPEPVAEDENELPGELDLDESHLEYEVSEEDLEDLDLSEEDLEGIDLDDIDLSDISEEDLQLDSEDTDYYEEESYEDFENESSGSDIFEASASSSSSTESGYKGLAERENKGVEFKYSDPQSRNSFTRIVVIGTVVILTLGFALWFAFLRGDGNDELAENTTPPPQETETPVQQPETQPEETPPADDPDPVPTQPETRPEPTVTNPGEVTKLTEKTGNSYIVIGSFVDEDLADDYATELATAGQSPLVIPPFDNHRFYRVAIASYASFSDANDAIADYKADYGEDIWALRY